MLLIELTIPAEDGIEAEAEARYLELAAECRMAGRISSILCNSGAEAI